MNKYGVLVVRIDNIYLDGWYTSHKMACEQYAFWVENEPQSSIHLIERKCSHWKETHK
jgi:hypothetical protein